MTVRTQHRTLSAHLADWDDARIARLLRRRPDLAHPSTPRDLADLAQRAQQHPSVTAAIDAATLPEDRLLQLVVCCRPDVPLDELAAALPHGVGLDDVEPVLDDLEDAALVWRHAGRLHCSGTLRQVMPTTLGPPLQAFVRELTVGYMSAAIKKLRVAAESALGLDALPPSAVGPNGRQPRKAELVNELEALLATPGVVDAVLASGPADTREIAAAMADHHPVVAVDHPLYFSSYSGTSYYARRPTYWLFERALLLPAGDWQRGVQPREVGVALRGGHPVADLALERPRLATGTADAAAIDSRAARRAAHTLHLLADLVDRWSATPAKALKSGGLGASAMKPVAAALEVELDEAGRLVELAHLAGLIGPSIVARKDGRRYVHDTFVRPTDAAAGWLDQPVAGRWAQLATAWLRAEHWPSASGPRPSSDRSAGAGDRRNGRKPVPLLTPQHAPTAPDRRRDVLGMLGTLEPGQATSPDALAAAVYWQCPRPWLHLGDVDAATAIGWVAAEAELLGIAASGALSSFGRALIAADHSAAERGLEAALPAPVRTFTVQTDLTATFVGDLDRDVLVELRLLADIESTGGATTLRFSDASLRRALDAGRDAEAILAFLEAHADKGVPQALAYLVTDVARRHGHLAIGAAASFVTSEDPAVLADACSHRRTRKLGLRLLAPTVAVSPQPPAKVLDGLRSAGFMPTADGESPGTVALAGAGAGTDANDQDRPRSADGPLAGTTAGKLPEPFRTRQRRGRGTPAVLDDAATLKLAEHIRLGRPDQAPLPLAATGPGADAALRPADRWGSEEADTDERMVDLAELDRLLRQAVDDESVLAIALGDCGDDADGSTLAEPIVLVVTGWRPGQVSGFDLEDGSPISILTEHIGEVIDLGPAEEILDVRRPARRGRSRGRRSRMR